MKAPNITQGEWMARKGDVLNFDRTYGISVYLSKEAHQEIDGDETEFPSRTEVIAEVCSGPTDEADAKFLAASKKMAKSLDSLRDGVIEALSLGCDIDPRALENMLQGLCDDAYSSLLEAGYTEE